MSWNNYVQIRRGQRFTSRFKTTMLFYENVEENHACSQNYIVSKNVNPKENTELLENLKIIHKCCYTLLNSTGFLMLISFFFLPSAIFVKDYQVVFSRIACMLKPSQTFDIQQIKKILTILSWNNLTVIYAFLRTNFPSCLSLKP